MARPTARIRVRVCDSMRAYRRGGVAGRQRSQSWPPPKYSHRAHAPSYLLHLHHPPTTYPSPSHPLTLSLSHPLPRRKFPFSAFGRFRKLLNGYRSALHHVSPRAGCRHACCRRLQCVFCRVFPVVPRCRLPRHHQRKSRAGRPQSTWRRQRIESVPKSPRHAAPADLTPKWPQTTYHKASGSSTCLAPRHSTSTRPDFRSRIPSLPKALDGEWLVSRFSPLVRTSH